MWFKSRFCPSGYINFWIIRAYVLALLANKKSRSESIYMWATLRELVRVSLCSPLPLTQQSGTCRVVDTPSPEFYHENSDAEQPQSNPPWAWMWANKLPFTVWSHWERVSCCYCRAACCWLTQSCLTLRPRGLQPARLLCPWDFPGKNTGVGCHFSSKGSSQPRNRTWVQSLKELHEFL